MIEHTQITSLKQLADYLRCDELFLNNFLNNSIIEFNSDKGMLYFYLKDQYPAEKVIIAEIRRIYLLKKNVNEHRIVHSIYTDKLQNSIKILNTALKSVASFPDSVHGFVPGKSIQTNAECHLSKKNILSIDIKRFFETISTSMVEQAFQKAGFEESVSASLAQLVTLEDKLVQGYNTSPTIANLVAKNLDVELIDYCRDNITYTRYADDLTFSSNDVVPNIDEIERIINKHNFTLNHRKTRYQYRGNKQFVTGLTVFDNKYPRIPKRIKRNLRLQIYYVSTRGYKAHALKQLNYSYSDYSNYSDIREEVEAYMFITARNIIGWINYINSIEPILSKKLLQELRPKRKETDLTKC